MIGPDLLQQPASFIVPSTVKQQITINLIQPLLY